MIGSLKPHAENPLAYPLIARRSFVKGLSAISLGLVVGRIRVLGAAWSTGRRYLLVGDEERRKIYSAALRRRALAAAEWDPGYTSLSESFLSISRSGARLRPNRVVAGNLAEFNEVIRREKIDVVAFLSPRAGDEAYLAQALDAGCEALIESPAPYCIRVITTHGKLNPAVRLISPYRYFPPCLQLKEQLTSGAIGELLSADFRCSGRLRYGLNLSGDNPGNGGTGPCFDLLNWWIGALPSKVYPADERYSARLNTSSLRLSYLNGVAASYSEVCEDEATGYQIAINGTRGRLEQRVTWPRDGLALVDRLSSIQIEATGRMMPWQGASREWDRWVGTACEGERKMFEEIFCRPADEDLGGQGERPSVIHAALVGAAVREMRGRREPITITLA